MSKTILDTTTRSALAERILKLTPESNRKWGTMTVGAMLCHVADAMEQALGRRSDRDRSNLFSRTLFKFLMVRVLPMPKGAPTSENMDPSKKGTHPQEFERDRNRVLALLEESGNWPADRALTPHPFFGPMTVAERGRLTWKHIDHHLKQFGA